MVTVDEPIEWGLWENGNIVCRYDGLVYPLRFVWDLSSNNEVFISRSDKQEITIWNVADCSIRNILKFGG
jgi:hypothetical protein